MGRRRKYLTEEERKAARKRAVKACWKKNAAKYIERHREYLRKWRQKHKNRSKDIYKQFTKEAQTKPIYGERLTENQKAILRRIATAVTADDID